MPKPRLPDFIIIGAMKSATTTLQEQLEQQPGIFMCDPKEPNFFSDDAQYSKGMAWYAELFSWAPAGALLGEASTHYTKIPTYPHAIARLRKHLPNVRLVYVMRHPMDRLVSHYIHEWSMGNIDCGIDVAVERHPELIAYGKYAMQLTPFFNTFGRSAVLPVFFDRIIRESQTELRRVCRFIGYTGAAQWVPDLRPANVSAERVRTFPFYRILIDSKPATWLRRAFVPKSWRDRVRSRLSMQQRPVLSEALRTELEREFDRDLSLLGKWLGAPLNCKNFKQVTAGQELNWVVTDD